MQSPIHQMHVDAENEREQLFVCHENGCGRRMVMKRPGEMVVLDQGDFFARHTGGSITFPSGISVSQ